MGSPQCRESMESGDGAASTYCLLPRGALGGPPENEVAPAWPQRCAWRPAVPGSTTSGPVTSPVALPQPGPRVAGWRSPCWTAPSLPVTWSRQVAVPGPDSTPWPPSHSVVPVSTFRTARGSRGTPQEHTRGAGAQWVDARAARWMRALPNRRRACGELCL